ncbi:MAG TPA: FtsQ-type POTRA domain-containing protein [Propionibacteriaceae bacterium]|nr:FtsQ-type POTRA domain-containing protein [Propionibacteriaceae bacterium]
MSITGGGRRRRVLLITALALVLVVGAAYAVFFSPWLVAENVTVTGNKQVSRAEVIGVAQVDSGLPLARQDVDAIAQRTLALPAVETATAVRKWPRTIEIAVNERRPVLAVRDLNGYLLVDRNGVAYQSSRSVPNGVVVADVIATDRQLLRQVAIVGSTLPGSLRKKASTLSATDPDRITLLLKSGVKVNWGSSADSPLKADIVMALLKRKPAASIDVSSPHNPAAR